MSQHARPLRTREGRRWLTPTLIAVACALTLHVGDVVSARQIVQSVSTSTATSPDGTTQFLLRVRADRVAIIAARYGLTVIGPVDENQHEVFLVSAPAPSSVSTGLSLSSSALSSGDSLDVDLIDAIQQDPEVDDFEPNVVVVTPEVAGGASLNHSTVEILDALRSRNLTSYFGTSAWTGYTRQPGVSAVRVSDTHDRAGTGDGIVAIIDTGVDPAHPLLSGALVPGYDFVNNVPGDASEWKDLDHSTVEILDHSTVEILDTNAAPLPLNPSTVAILNGTTPIDPALLPAAFGHGTMVAGVVRLVAPTARIMPLKAFRADGTSHLYDIVRAIYYAVDNGARVINMSFSATTASPELARAINYATDRGVICVASAGNLGREVVVYPAGYRNVLAVASTNTSWGAPRRSLFSNYGDALVSLAAPGEGIVTTYPGGGYAAAWGTSFSAPMVAGGAALMVKVDPAVNHQRASELFARATSMPGGMGRGRLNLYEAVRALRDVVSPTVSVLSPSTGSVVSGTVVLSASASDNLGVRGLRFTVNGQAIGSELSSPPYQVSWATATVPNGTYQVAAIARDAEGNTVSSSTTITVTNDALPPAVSLTSPTANAIIGGTVMVTATATDDLGVMSVRFALDGTPLGSEDATAPYEIAWDTSAAIDGVHTLAAIARDAAGKETSTTLRVTVTHDTTPPTIALVRPVPGSIVSSAVMMIASAADNVGVTSVQFLVGGAPLGGPLTVAPFEMSWSTLGLANGPYVLSAVARDAAGHVATASPVAVNVINDVLPPVVDLVSPTAGATLAGVFTIGAVASDDVAIASVEFLLDDVPLAVADTAAPYEVEWTTTTVINGAHTLTAVARDVAGRETRTTAPVIVSNEPPRW